MSASFGGRLMIAMEGDLSPTAEDCRRLARSATGGAILFARNFADAAQLRQLTADIRRAAGRRILIAVDQEGGRVQRFRGGGFTPLPAAAELQTEDAARDAGIVAAAELAAAGIDLSFAPSLDLARGRSRIIGDRAFAADGEKAAALALSFAAGMRAAGMQCCGKHFPGHGYARADSHKTLPADDREFAAVAAADLIPFARWAAREMPALMTAHIVFPKCDNAAATFSPFWLQKILRERLHFGGMIVSDDLSMKGANVGAIGERMRAALAAGCDGLLLCEPQDVRAALAAAEAAECKNAAADNPWLRLSPQADGRICIGDAAYAESRARLVNTFGDSRSRR